MMGSCEKYCAMPARAYRETPMLRKLMTWPTKMLARAG